MISNNDAQPKNTVNGKHEITGWAFSAFTEAAAALARTKSEDLLIQEVCGSISKQGPYVLAWVGKAEDDLEKTVSVIGGAGSAIDYLKNISVSWSDQNTSGHGPAGVCIRSDKSSVVFDAEVDEGFKLWRNQAKNFGIRSAVGCPVPGDGTHPFGCLLVYSKVPNAFGPSEVQLFEALAQEIGFGIRSIDRQHQLDNQIHAREVVQERLAAALRSTIEAMSRTMEWRDPYTAGHQKRVALISMEIAKGLGMDNESIQALYMAAMVHDIGKVAVPAEILTKPSRLSELEMKLVQEHVEAGYQILKDIPFPWPIAEMVRQHHERLDGSGYPQGLHGEQICKEARILAVADTIEAMSTHRPYRQALGLTTAMKAIRSQAGTTLDAGIVKVAYKLFTDSDTLQHIIEQS